MLQTKLCQMSLQLKCPKQWVDLPHGWEENHRAPHHHCPHYHKSNLPCHHLHNVTWKRQDPVMWYQQTSHHRNPCVTKDHLVQLGLLMVLVQVLALPALGVYNSGNKVVSQNTLKKCRFCLQCFHLLLYFIVWIFHLFDYKFYD